MNSIFALYLYRESECPKLRDGLVESLWVGAKYKKYSRKGKLKEKKSCTPNDP